MKKAGVDRVLTIVFLFFFFNVLFVLFPPPWPCRELTFTGIGICVWLNECEKKKKKKESKSNG